MFQYFTIASANQALPEVKKKFEILLAKKSELANLERELSLTVNTNNSLEPYILLKQKLNSKIKEFYQSIEDLENTGVVIKGIEQGLLDFPSKRFDEDVWLCWKTGEEEVKFWHETDVGFNGRKPIAVDDKALI